MISLNKLYCIYKFDWNLIIYIVLNNNIYLFTSHFLWLCIVFVFGSSHLLDLTIVNFFKNSWSIWSYNDRFSQVLLYGFLLEDLSYPDQPDLEDCSILSSRLFLVPVIDRVAGAWTATPAPSRSLDDDRSGPATLVPVLTPEPPTPADLWDSEAPEVVPIVDFWQCILWFFKWFPSLHFNPTARGFLIKVFLPLGRLPSKAEELVLPFVEDRFVSPQFVDLSNMGDSAGSKLPLA
jgi:hypothetical protein